ncbi:MAG: bifunctional phosphopantothenoylcysteine decarboxylase/phosphopantothenate--cysteine ligase CoaBC [Xanthomonadaceae bacterium]|nr:bifunctional phosphopantothenoylcysteine decarboxylase/phosphopantothenate--cysteine ligase CoaBC [Xanthomonadaceae bacterium]
MHGQRIIVGITGGIAAYKAAELVRRLVERGAEVQVVMTRGAKEFITPLTMQAVSGRPIRDDLWDLDAEAAMGHIELARWAERVIVAPATADFLARLARGEANDLLTTLCLATEAPVAVAPAMNRIMWSNPATQANVETLRARGVEVLGPGDGSQACGETGPGRMLEPDAILNAIVGTPGVLAGVRVLVTAGPTREAIDPVRYMTNRSSGKMGYAVAVAARAAGAEVTLVSGPTALAPPAGILFVAVESAADMRAAVAERVGDAEVFIAAAAVADWTPADPAGSKLKKGAAAPPLAFEPTIDILAEVAARAAAPFTVGFAAETDDLEAHARRKLTEKRLDMIAANAVGDGRGFDADDNELLVLWKGGERQLPRAHKRALATQLVALIAERLKER